MIFNYLKIYFIINLILIPSNNTKQWNISNLEIYYMASKCLINNISPCHNTQLLFYQTFLIKIKIKLFILVAIVYNSGRSIIFGCKFQYLYLDQKHILKIDYVNYLNML